MKLPGRITAAIEILEDFESRRVPLKSAIADWGRNNRYAGSKDRAWISGLCLDVLRKRQSLALAMHSDVSRALVFGALRFLWNINESEIATAVVEEHGPGALSDAERESLQASDMLTSQPLSGDYPEWLSPNIERVFGDRAKSIMTQFADRADIDLRLNTLKVDPEKSLKALMSVHANAVAPLKTAARIAAPDPREKAPGVTVIPAFNKGWVEVQDLGSQIAAASAGGIKGAQVLDYCAGGGGKTLALAALMENTGQLYAYDRDPRRLKPLFHRAKRAGVRNLQIRSPAGDEGLDDLKSKMDVVFIDAPCSGAGTWRRHPDTKWRLTPQQLQRRHAEQDTVLRQAATFVRPGGRMVWVTCSFLMEENEDRLAAFQKDADEFLHQPALEQIQQSGLMSTDGIEALNACVTPDGALRLTPDALRADGFFIATLTRKG